LPRPRRGFARSRLQLHLYVWTPFGLLQQPDSASFYDLKHTRSMPGSSIIYGVSCWPAHECRITTSHHTASRHAINLTQPHAPAAAIRPSCPPRHHRAAFRAFHSASQQRSMQQLSAHVASPARRASPHRSPTLTDVAPSRSPLAVGMRRGVRKAINNGSKGR
jgi:hypothetical protein